MGGKDQRRLVVQSELREQFMGARLNFDTAQFGMRRIVLPDVIEMGEFGADAAEIVPDAGEDGLDLLGRFFRERRGQVGAANFVFPHSPAHGARDAAEQVCGLDRVEIAGGAQQSGGKRADRRVGERFCSVAKGGFAAEEGAAPRDEMSRRGQAGSRVRTSEAFWPPKPNEFDITAVTRASRALFGTTSNRMAGSGIS